jgi:hypothetical protein
MLSAKYNRLVQAQNFARMLGARGGRARARRLSPDRRRRIAAQGGAARRESLAAARRIADNFVYLESVTALRGERPDVVRLARFDGQLPGHYPDRRS